MTRLLAIAVLLAPCWPQAGAQAPVPRPVILKAGSSAWTISGVVLSAGGAPLDRASVTLSRADAEDTQIAQTTTGESGAFRFSNLPAGKYRLDASRRGYIASAYQEHAGGYFTGVVTGPGLDTQELQLHLLPEAVIGGTITDDSGEPVGGAQVTLYRDDRHTGQHKVVRSTMAVTDDTGAYEFARLKPATYYVAVSASPWYAVHPQLPPGGPGGASSPGAQSPLDVAYPLTFYANATDSDSATPIPLSAGDHQQINISLHAVPAVHVRVRLPVPDNPGRGFTIPQLSREVFGTQEFVPLGGLSTVGSSGSMVADLGGVAPGKYVLRQIGSGSDQADVSIDVTGNQTLEDPSTSPAGVDLTGKVEMANGSPLPEHTTLTLVSVSAGRNLGRLSSVAADGTFSLPAVPPGVWDVRVEASEPPLAVWQMAASGAEANGSRLTIGNDPVLLAATLVSGSATVSGYVRRNGTGFGGALVLLVPTDPKSSQDLYRVDQSNSDGSFQLSRVFPGNYTLVAIDGGWGLDWASRDVLAPWLAHGLNVQVLSHPAVDLPQPVEVQAR